MESTVASTIVDGSEIAASPGPLRTGEIFLGKYRIEGSIGAGGMGSVVLARHVDLGTQYAIKVLHMAAPDRSAVDRFRREAKMCAMLEHPNIVRVFDCGEHDGHCYIIMEYLRGEDLRRRLKRVGRFSLEETVRFAGVVCDVLSVMHEAGIVHRDLKPDNIVFSQQGGREVAKILDFGIAKLATASTAEHLTRTGTVVGTPAYMSPEQCKGGEVDGRSDIYSLGVILFQMLTGRLPFDTDQQLTMMYMHVNQEPPAAHEWEPSVPPAVSEAIERMMAKSPADRPRSSASCAVVLAEASGISIPIPPASEDASQGAGGVPTRLGPPATTARSAASPTEDGSETTSARRRGRIVYAAALGLVVVLAAGYGIYRWYAVPPASSGLATAQRSTTEPVANLARLARDLAEQEKYDEAEAKAREAVALDPNSSVANTALALALLDQLKYADAFLYAQRAVELDDNDPGAHVALATYDMAGPRQNEQAIAEAKRALALNPDPEVAARANLTLGAAYVEQERYDEALEAFMLAKEYRGGYLAISVLARMGIADARAGKQDTEGGIRDLEAIATDPQTRPNARAAVCMRIAKLKLFQGKYDETVAYGEQALTTATLPGLRAATEIVMGLGYALLDRPADAVKASDEAMALGGEDRQVQGYAHAIKGAALTSQRRKADGRRELLLAHQILPDDPMITQLGQLAGVTW